MLELDLGKAQRYIYDAITVDLTQYQYDAIVLLLFNAGNSALGGNVNIKEPRNLTDAINVGQDGWDADLIWKEWDWGRSDLESLAYRRDLEVALFLTGICPESLVAS